MTTAPLTLNHHTLLITAYDRSIRQGEGWESQALCASANPRLSPEWWFSDKPSDINRAKDICESCPVKGRCLSEARDRREEYGIWGGVRFSAAQLCRRGHDQSVHSIVVSATRRCGICYRMAQQARDYSKRKRRNVATTPTADVG